MIHHVFANRSNIGDWLSAMGIQRLLAPLPVTEYLCDGPFVETTLAALERVPATDVIVIGGGGLFMDYFEPFWRGFLEIAGDRPFCIWGAGCCSMRSDDSEIDVRLARAVVRRAAICSVRDQLTAGKLGLSAPAVLCPSITVLPAPGPADGLILHSCSYEESCPNSYWALRTATRRHAAITGRKFEETNNRIKPGSLGELDRLLDKYARAEVVLSARLHGCIIAAALGRKVVAVAHDWKVDEFMGAIGLSDWVVPYFEISRVPELLDRIECQPPVAGKLAEAVEANRGIAWRIRALYHQVQRC